MSYRNLLEMAAHTVASHSNKVALQNPIGHGKYRTWTYAQLWEDVRKVAAELASLGVQAEDRVGLVSESRAWWLISDLAIMSLRAITVPVFPNLGAAQIFEIFDHAGIKGVFAQDKGQAEKILSLQGMWTSPLEFMVLYDSTSGEPSKEEVENAGYGYYHFFDWLDSAALLTEDDWRQIWEPLTRDDLATFVYTSGTTGKPKGVQLTHGNLLANVEGIAPIVPIYDTDEGITYLPLSHIFERTASQFVLLNAGAKVTYSEGIDKIVGEFAVVAPTVFTTVPRLLEKVHEGVFHKVQNSSSFQQWMFQKALKAAVKGRVLKQSSPMLWFYDSLVLKKIRSLFGGRLRLIVAGGAPLPPYVFEFFTALGICVVEGYGLTETSPVIAANPVDDARKGTVGKILDNVEVKIADDGEILVRGESISRGYYKNPEATEQAYEPDGWFRTGDIGEVTSDGYLKITDRKKNLLVLSTGKNVAPAPIESAILASSLIEQVLVIGNGRKFVSAIVVPDTQALKHLQHRIRTQEAGHGAAQTHQDDAPANGLRQLHEPEASSDAHNSLQNASAGDGLQEANAGISRSDLQKLLLDAVKRHTSGFAEYEQPKKIIIAREPFTVENELLTPTLKVRANLVLEAYSEEIDALYQTAARPTEERTKTGTD